jgi:hypothetical protein
MCNVELIYFSLCPNTDRAREVLRNYFEKFTEVNQDDLEENDPYLRFSSPTILIDGQVVAGSVSSSSACSVINWDSISSVVANLKAR